MNIIYTIYSNIFVCVLFREFDATCLTDIMNVFKDKVQICTKLLTGAAAELSIDSRPRVVIHLFLYRARTAVFYRFLSQTHDRGWAHITECKANSPSMCCSIKPLGCGYFFVSSQLICSDPNCLLKRTDKTGGCFRFLFVRWFVSVTVTVFVFHSDKYNHWGLPNAGWDNCVGDHFPHTCTVRRKDNNR